MSIATRSVREIVRDIIERDAAIRIGLARGLINSRALARYIMVSTNATSSFEAIHSAIRRYPIKASAAKYQKAGSFVAKLMMRNKIAEVDLQNGPGIFTSLARFSSEINYETGETFQLASGIEAITVVVDGKNFDKLLAAIPKKNVLKTYRNLTEIVITLSDVGMKTPGVLARIATELAINEVNIIDCMSYEPPPTVVIAIEEKDGVKAYQSIERLNEAQQ